MDNMTPGSQAPPKSNTITFGSKPPLQTGPSADVIAQISNITRRVRIIEEAVSNLRKKSTIDEENTLAELKKLHTTVKSIYTEVDALKKEQSSFKEEMRKMIREFQSVAKRDEVEVLKKYIKLWEPVQFATVSQVEHMIRDAQLVPQEDLAQLREQVSQHTQMPKPSNSIYSEEKEETSEDASSKDEFKPSDSHNTYAQYTQNQTPHEQEVEEEIEHEEQPLVSAEQKRAIAKLIEEYDDIRELLLNDPHEFAKKVDREPRLSKLFNNVDVVQLSEKLKPHYDD